MEDDVAPGSSQIDLSDLQEAVIQAVEALNTQTALLSLYLSYMTPEQRQQITKPPLRFLDAGKRVASASRTAPGLLAATRSYSPEEVLQNIAIAEILGPLVQHSQMLAQLATDTRNKHLDLAYDASLDLYRIGKFMGKVDPQILEVIKPITQMFSGRGKGGDKDEGAAAK